MFHTYGKSILAFLYAVATVVIPLVTGDGRVDPLEGVTIAIAVVTNAGVWLIPLAPQAAWTKTAAGVLLAGLNVAVVVIVDNVIDANETMMIAASVLAALGIAAAPAESPKAMMAVGWGTDRAV